MNGWVAAFAPAGTPPDIIAKLNKAFAEVIQSPEFEKLHAAARHAGFRNDTPADFGAFQQGQVKMWADVLKKAGVERE